MILFDIPTIMTYCVAAIALVIAPGPLATFAGRIDFFELARVGRARPEYCDAHALGDVAGHGSDWGANANRCTDCSVLSGN